MYEGRVIIEFPSMKQFGLHAAMVSRRVKVIQADAETGSLTPLPHIAALKLNIALDGIVTASVTRFIPTGKREEPFSVEYAEYIVAEVRVSEEPGTKIDVHIPDSGAAVVNGVLQHLRGRLARLTGN